ncbi:MAG: hypothetical protein FWH42_01855 [Dehalococcoidia bacterium]|nr:hypothetical protein [Dehalococcoidia bacterium]
MNKKAIVVRPPRQTLATFGVTNVSYYVLSHPAYSGEDNTETVVRRGQVIANRPQIVTPYYLSRLDGFSADAQRYFEKLILEHGADAPSLFYTYRNEHKSTEIAGDTITAVIQKIDAEIDARNDPLAAIIRSEDMLWDVSLMDFIFRMTLASIGNNVSELRSRGFLGQGGALTAARANIEEMFRNLRKGELEPRELQKELERWGLFEEYQDRFFAAFRR